MREVAFIKQNKEKWLNFEQSFFRKELTNPDELAGLYMELVNDLAYAQTFYPKSNTVLYLNELASKAYLSIYKTRRLEQNRLLSFFKYDVPFVAFQYRKQLYYSFLIFFIFVLIGVLSTLTDDSFVRLILGDEYVNKTLENIANDDPVAVYKSGSEWGGFLAITINNIKVAFNAFVLGIFGGIGTFYVLMQNGIMLGAFQTMFYNNNVLGASMRGIWIHGAMEIFAIIVSGGAGFILAKGILFPRTYSRLESFKKHFADGTRLLVGTLPFFIAAGFLEGFVTRYSDRMPQVGALVIILGTFLAVFFYFIIYPFILNSKIRKKNEFISKA